MDRIPTRNELQISTLGPCRRPSPLGMSTIVGDCIPNFVRDDVRIRFDIEVRSRNERRSDTESESEVVADLVPAFEMSGPRQFTFFDPTETVAAVVTCGGLCPGLNNVVRSLFFELSENYGVPEVLGIRYGYRGLNPNVAVPPLRLTSERVDDIHKMGGTMLGTSRGPQDPKTIVDFLQSRQINQLYCVGGDGTQRGAHKIADEISRRNLAISVIGIPKTIDNDVRYVWRTFGFVTAVSEAAKIIDCAHTEAKSVPNGIGLVKLMGRQAGFIAAAASLASGQVDFTLIPEIEFQLNGEDGLLAKIDRRIAARGHAVVVVAEGAGQDLMTKHAGDLDASGNLRLSDIGPFLKAKIVSHFDAQREPATVKYLDPSYHIRSVPANTTDSLHCDQFARHAAHAAMAGKTDLLIGYWHNQFVHVPLDVSTGASKRLSPEGDLWRAVLATTRQETW